MADRSFRKQKNIDNAIKMLAAVVEVLNQYQIKYYLDFGTLIGAMRDNSLIPWDDDIDISLIDESDYAKVELALEAIRTKFGYRTYLLTYAASTAKRKKQNQEMLVDKIEFTDENNFNIAKIRNNMFWKFGRGNTTLDIFFKYKYNGDLYWMAYGKINCVPMDVFDESLSEIDFYGIKCTIPTYYDRYLTYKYGDWKTPNPKWTHQLDDKSIV